MEEKAPFVTRFAPSPNGWLHLGHAYSALVADACAKAHGGTFLVRIEDIDIGRARPHFVDGIEQDLHWLGLEWPTPVMHQSSRFDIYAASLERLRDLNLVYPCWATRREITEAIGPPDEARNWPRDPDGALIYPGLYRYIDETRRQELMWRGGSYAWRLDMEAACALAEDKNNGPLSYLEVSSGTPVDTPVDARLYGDVIVARKDVPTSYHLAVTLDDAAQQVTQVTRGQDLQAATAVHRVLQTVLDLPVPTYFHHQLIRDVSGRRLSKQAGDHGFRDLRQQGLSLDDVMALLPPIG